MEEYIVRVYGDRREWFQNIKQPDLESESYSRHEAKERRRASDDRVDRRLVNLPRHRTDGPAVEYTNGNEEYWIEGSRYTKRRVSEKDS